MLTNPCEHCFHRNCIEQWMETSRTCPVCRRTVSSLSTRVLPPEPAPAPDPSDADFNDLVDMIMTVSLIEVASEDQQQLENDLLAIAQLESNEPFTTPDAPENWILNNSRPDVLCSICLNPLTDVAVAYPCCHEFDFQCINSVAETGTQSQKKCPSCDNELQAIYFNFNSDDSYSVKKVS